MSLLSELLLALAHWVWHFSSTRGDRRRIAQGLVRCAVRAGHGRVSNIGTEWSVGTGTLTPGLLRFEPQLGVVGVRKIPVHRIRGIGTVPVEHVVVPWEDSAHLEVDTGAGELHLIVPAQVAGDVVERLS